MIILNYVRWVLIILLFILKLKTFFADINNDVEKWFDSSNYDRNEERPLKIGVKKKVIGKFKDELGGKS